MKMLLEEMAELQKEICKAWRGKDNEVEIAEEVADVEIMLEQIKLISALMPPLEYTGTQRLSGFGSA